MIKHQIEHLSIFKSILIVNNYHKLNKMGNAAPCLKFESSNQKRSQKGIAEPTTLFQKSI